MDARQIAALVLLGTFGATAGGVSLTACSADGPAPGATRPTSGDTDPADEEDGDDETPTATGTPDAGTARPPRADAGDAGRPSRDAGACPEDASVRPFVREAGVGVYCRRSLDGGRHGNCAPGQACVFTGRTSTANGACVPEPPETTPSGGIVYGCQGPQDCTGGQVCCSQGGGVERDRCGALRAQSRFSGARCQASCGATETELCEVDGTCSEGKTCVGFTAFSTRLGACTE